MRRQPTGGYPYDFHATGCAPRARPRLDWVGKIFQVAALSLPTRAGVVHPYLYGIWPAGPTYFCRSAGLIP